MPGAEIAQYGIATFALAGVFYLAVIIMRKNGGTHDYYNNSTNKRNNAEFSVLVEVIKNNTKALEQVTEVVQALRVDQARQEQKVDELLSKARTGK